MLSRSAEFPERVVRPDLRYYPPRIRTQNSWVVSRSSPISALTPTAVHRVRRTFAMFPDEMGVAGPSKNLPRLPGPEAESPSRGPIKRRTAETKIPGAFPRSDSFDIEQNLDEHVRMIEVEFVTRRRSKGGQYSDISQSPREVLKPVSTNRARRTDKMERRSSISRSKPEIRQQQTTEMLENKSQTGLDHDLNHQQSPTPSSRTGKPSRVPKKPDSRRPQHTTFVLRGHTTSTNIRPGTAQPATSKVKPGLKGFRRLSLGDISSSTLEGLFR